MKEPIQTWRREIRALLASDPVSSQSAPEKHSIAVSQSGTQIAWLRHRSSRLPQFSNHWMAASRLKIFESKCIKVARQFQLIVKSLAISIAKRNLAECAGEYHAGFWPLSTLRISEINFAGLNGLLRKHSTPKSDNTLRKQ